MKKVTKVKQIFAKSIVVLAILLTPGLTIAQVITRVLSEKEAVTDFLPFSTEESPIVYRQPTIDFEEILKEDERNNRTLQRFAVKTNVDYSLENGTWTNYETFSVWKIAFNAPDASSLSFAMKDIKLPESAEMYIYSLDKKIIQGPITSKNLFETTFTSDVIEDNEVEIAVIIQNQEQEMVSFKINGIGQGIKLKKVSSRAWQEASDCNIDVNCPIGTPWAVERDAVMLILNGQEDLCSGALINNLCQDLTPNILTADHCLTGKNPANFVFRFRFESAIPTCPGNSTGNQGTWITFNGATLRASSPFTASDFALLLMGGNIAGIPNLALAGWNRNLAIPQQTVTAIHHPFGDAKKISIDDEALGVANANLWGINQWDTGLVQQGSSGCPLFDANRRIIGQLRSGINNIGCNTDGTSLVDNNTFGRLSVSWTAGLNGFLAGANAPMTTNSIRVPSIDNGGNTFVCTTNRQFILQNPIPGKVVSWTVTNPALFASTTSGTGTIATLRAAAMLTGGSSTVTFTLTQAGCTPVVITQNIWVGVPALPTTNPHGNPAISLGIGQNKLISLSGTAASLGLTSRIGTWGATGAVSTSSAPAISAKTYTGTTTGVGNFSVFTSNVCGNSLTKFGGFNVSGNCNPCPKVVFNTPNPASSTFLCEIPAYLIPKEYADHLSNTVNKLEIIDFSGKVQKEETFLGSSTEVNTNTLNAGLHFTKVQTPYGSFMGKIIIVK